MNSPSTPDGPGPASGAPHLPDGFADTSTSRYIDPRELRQRVVAGGEAPPVLLVHGRPPTWYAWRPTMPGLARHFQIIAPGQHGTALAGQPGDGYDTGPWPPAWPRGARRCSPPGCSDRTPRPPTW
jgi:pimeloyl-ACP methyl ester carboxylesterase